jgi:hypothetical protein
VTATWIVLNCQSTLMIHNSNVTGTSFLLGLNTCHVACCMLCRMSYRLLGVLSAEPAWSSHAITNRVQFATTLHCTRVRLPAHYEQFSSHHSTGVAAPLLLWSYLVTADSDTTSDGWNARVRLPVHYEQCSSYHSTGVAAPLLLWSYLETADSDTSSGGWNARVRLPAHYEQCSSYHSSVLAAPLL